MDALPSIVVELISPIFNLIIPSSRFFWGYLAAALVIGLGVCYWRQKSGRSLEEALLAAFPRSIYLHPSAVVDYKFAIVNHALWVLLFGFLIFGLKTGTSGTVIILQHLLGADGPALAPGAVASVVFTLLSVMALDFGIFLAHWLQHKVPLLWEFHKVHHSAAVLTPATDTRMHPVDIIVVASIPATLMGTANGVFLYLYSDPVAMVTVMGVNAVTFVGFAIGYHLKHTHIWLMFPRGIREHISSPAMHWIHHSKDPKHYDKNMARIFTIWDRLAGTLYIPEEYEEIECGMIDDEHLEFDSVWQLYVLPFKNVARRWLPSKVTAR